MDLFNEAIIQKIFGSIITFSDVSTTILGQRFKLVINRIAWYGVHIILEIDPRAANNNLFLRKYL